MSHSNTAIRRSSFYWPIRCMRGPKRHAMQALYQFCRAVDDIADSDLPTEEKHARLDDWEQEIALLYAGNPQHSISRQLLPAVQSGHLKQYYFNEIIAGMRMDVDAAMCCPDLSTLELYCYRVAGCVGLLTVAILGCHARQAEDFANYLGQAMQRTNILRDVFDDAAMGRIYLPKEWLNASLTPQCLSSHREMLVPALEHMADSAQDYYHKAQTAMADLDQSTLVPALMMRDVYQRLLVTMRKDGWAFRQAYTLGLADKLAVGKQWLRYCLAA